MLAKSILPAGGPASFTGYSAGIIISPHERMDIGIYVREVFVQKAEGRRMSKDKHLLVNPTSQTSFIGHTCLVPS